MTATLALTTIVLVHALGNDRHAWDDVQKRLAAAHVDARVITVELPGHGDNLPRAEEPAALGYAHVARLQIELFDQSKHWVMWDEPDKFVATLATFVASLPTTGGRR